MAQQVPTSDGKQTESTLEEASPVLEKCLRRATTAPRTIKTFFKAAPKTPENETKPEEKIDKTMSNGVAKVKEVKQSSSLERKMLSSAKDKKNTSAKEKDRSTSKQTKIQTKDDPDVVIEVKDEVSDENRRKTRSRNKIATKIERKSDLSEENEDENDTEKRKKKGMKRSRDLSKDSQDNKKQKVLSMSNWLKPKNCPICNKQFPSGTSNVIVNQHIDGCLIE